jgi:hypothetical protein
MVNSTKKSGRKRVSILFSPRDNNIPVGTNQPEVKNIIKRSLEAAAERVIRYAEVIIIISYVLI